MITMRIRQTHARIFNFCQRKYKFQVIDKIVPKDHSIHLSIGTAAHAGRASYLRYHDKMKALEAVTASLKAEAEIYPILAERPHNDKLCYSTRQTCLSCANSMSLEMILSYTEWFDKTYGDSMQILGVELPFELKIAEYEDLELWVAGTIDADAIWAEKYRLNFEYKTTKKQLPTFLEEEYMSIQHTTYPMALHKITGAEVYGTQIDVSRKPLKTKGSEHDKILLPKTNEDYAEVIRD